MHIPNHDPRVQSIILQILGDLGPRVTYILDGGDGIEGHSLNSYDKTHSELVGLQAELDADYLWRSRINNAAPGTTRILLTCNHFSARLARAKKHNYFLSDLKAMEQENLFRLKELGWTLKQEFLWKDNILFIHGDGGSAGSQKVIINEARNLAKENGVSIVRFHSHTTGYEIHRKLGRCFHAIQIGCGMDLKKGPSYIKHGSLLPNWTNSIGVFYLRRDGSGYFYVPVLIDSGVAVFNNKVYRG